MILISNEIHSVYQQLIEAWNSRNAREMADLFTMEGEIIGFDGSQEIGREKIFSHLSHIFSNHPTAPFVTKVKNIRFLGPDAAVLRAIAGMVPHGKSDLNPDVNTHHTLVAVKEENKWLIQLFQNTPAMFHGRPHLVEEMTEELRQLLS
ncbi:DUF4440 domain-containing protein [Bacillus sp. UMB0893]|nr:DUF4440 domain-containing protein [Bacillus sp. UMB0893]